MSNNCINNFLQRDEAKKLNQIASLKELLTKNSLSFQIFCFKDNRTRFCAVSTKIVDF